MTVYMGTSNSSKETRDRASTLAKEIGSYHVDAKIDSVVYAVVALFQTLTGVRSKKLLLGCCSIAAVHSSSSNVGTEWNNSQDASASIRAAELKSLNASMQQSSGPRDTSA